MKWRATVASVRRAAAVAGCAALLVVWWRAQEARPERLLTVPEAAGRHVALRGDDLIIWHVDPARNGRCVFRAIPLHGGAERVLGSVATDGAQVTVLDITGTHITCLLQRLQPRGWKWQAGPPWTSASGRAPRLVSGPPQVRRTPFAGRTAPVPGEPWTRTETAYRIVRLANGREEAVPLVSGVAEGGLRVDAAVSGDTLYWLEPHPDGPSIRTPGGPRKPTGRSRLMACPLSGGPSRLVAGGLRATCALNVCDHGVWLWHQGMAMRPVGHRLVPDFHSEVIHGLTGTPPKQSHWIIAGVGPRRPLEYRGRLFWVPDPTPGIPAEDEESAARYVTSATTEGRGQRDEASLPADRSPIGYGYALAVFDDRLYAVRISEAYAAVALYRIDLGANRGMQHVAWLPPRSALVGCAKDACYYVADEARAGWFTGPRPGNPGNATRSLYRVRLEQ